jgi:hypothetical protein
MMDQQGPSLRLGIKLAQPEGPAARVSVPHFLPEDGRRCSFRNVVILLKYRRWTKPKKTLLQIIRHRGITWRGNRFRILFPYTKNRSKGKKIFEDCCLLGCSTV